MRKRDEAEIALEYLFELSFSHLTSKSELKIDEFLIYVEHLIEKSKGE